MMTAQQTADYNRGIANGNSHLKDWGTPKKYRFEDGYGIGWTNADGTERSAAVSNPSNKDWQAGYSSVLNAAMTKAGYTSGLPTEVSSNNAPADNGGAIISGITTMVSSNNYVKWILIAVGGWFLWKWLKKRR